MFVTTNIIPIARASVEAFLRDERAAGAIYRELGGLGNELLVADSLAATYGCRAYGAVLDLAEDETVCLVLDRFRDRAHYEEVMGRANADARITALFATFTAMVDLGRVVRGEFTGPD